MQQLNRFEPSLPAHAYRTFAIAAPIPTHFRAGTCAEADCAAYESGWRSLIDESAELGQKQAHYIRNQAGRAFTETRDEAGVTVFEFPAGQTCFREHQVPLERDARYLVRGGDWRGDPRGEGTREHLRPDLWVEEFAENLDSLATARERG